jgi:hypothetical protein
MNIVNVALLQREQVRMFDPYDQTYGKKTNFTEEQWRNSSDQMIFTKCIYNKRSSNHDIPHPMIPAAEFVLEPVINPDCPLMNPA